MIIHNIIITHTILSVGLLTVWWVHSARERNAVGWLADGSVRERTTDVIGPSDPHCANVCAVTVKLALLMEGGSGVDGGGRRRRGRVVGSGKVIRVHTVRAARAFANPYGE
ncbi:hypothetical protein QTP88_007448 [Uroleucon formosanum]